MALAVLPEAPVPHALRRKLALHVGEVLHRHPSGTPWIVGDSGIRRVAQARNEKIEIVLVGQNIGQATGTLLASQMRQLQSVSMLDVLAESFVESDILLFARERGRMRSQAPLFLARSLFWATVDGVSLIADDQLTLKAISQAEPDKAVLASRLTDAELSYPFSLRSIWSGVESLAPGEWLDSRSTHPPRRQRWWTPPDPIQPIGELASSIHSGIYKALERRIAEHKTISSDLSGGLDSSTLSFFLADFEKQHHTLFLSSSNVANNDHYWADRAAHEIGSHHIVAPYRSVILSLLNGDTGSVGSFPEGPSMSSVAVASVPVIEDLMSTTGSTLHINGHGGDALFGPVSTILWSLVRSRDRRRFQKAWRHRVINQYPILGTARMLIRSQPYRSDLMSLAQSRFETSEADVSSFSRWITAPRVHTSLTRTARGLLRQLAREAIDSQAQALSEDRTTHQIIQYLIVHGTTVRRMNHARSSDQAVLFESPYLDRGIVDVALSLEISDRAYQAPAKPLLAAARPRRMDLDYFQRRDKGDYTREVFEQHSILKTKLRELFKDGSTLEDMELVSPARLLRSVEEYSTDGRVYMDLVYIGFAERWLRSVRASERSGATVEGGAKDWLNSDQASN